MELIKMWLVAAFLAMAGEATAQTMTFGDVNVRAGGTDTLRISLSTDTPIAAWQMKIRLPQGLSLAKNASGSSYRYSLPESYSKDYLFGVDPSAGEQMQEDGYYTLVCFAKTRSNYIVGDDQELCTLTFQADGAYTGKEDIVIWDIHLSGRTAKNYQMGGLTLSSVLSGISDVRSDDRQSEALFTIDGRRLNVAPGKGIYIRGGKKVIVK